MAIAFRSRLRPQLRWGLPAIMVAVVLAVASTACVHGTTYRTRLPPEGGYCVPDRPDDCAQEVLYAVDRPGDAVGTPPVLVGYVEFDDQGYLREPALKDALIQRLDRLAAERPLLVVVFAHGWKHNAAGSDGNVQAFNRFLLKLAAADQAVCAGMACRERQVVGVYLGWRGLSNRVEPFKTLTFWGRKSRAHRVGGDGAIEVLAELGKIKSRKREGNIDQYNRMIVAGHSFGGALVYSATHQTLVRDTAFLNRNRVPRTVADLVVLVNPAFEAARFHAIQRKASEFPFQPGQRPVLAIFTSQNDTATRKAFPVGRRLSTLFSEHRDAEQRRQNTTAIGHYAPYRTHLLRSASSADSAGTGGIGRVACTWEAFRKGELDTWQAGATELARLAPPDAGAQRFNPYLVVSVEKGIISSHNDIWGEQFADFLYRFVAVQSFGACASTRRIAPTAEATADDRPPPLEVEDAELQEDDALR